MADYDVALSFAGEQRSYVGMVNDELKGLGVSTFYDEENRAFLWGREMNETLTDVYQNRARFVLMFISQEYASKVWPTVERRAAFATAITKNEEFVLPARFDDTALPGLLRTVSYIDLRTHSPRQLALLICEKLGRPVRLQKANVGASGRSTATTGEVTFNYSSNNNRFRIGQSAYEFETYWGKRGAGSIYCLNDPPSIRGVALAPNASKLADIIDASQLDYSSRHRAVHAGHFVVLQNTSGFYAAIKILDVRYDDAEVLDLMSIKYWILTDGSANFSKTEE
jgi:TIR domain